MLMLCFRNMQNDRANALLHLPLIGQEALQVLLWLYIGDSADECSSLNRGLSFAVCAVIFSIPGWMTAVHLALTNGFGSDEPFIPAVPNSFGGGSTAMLVRVLRANLVFSGLFWATALSTVGVGMRAGRWPSCTYAGPWGHQVWPAYLGPWYATVVGLLWFFTAMGGTILYPRGDNMLVPGFVIIGPAFVVLLCIMMADPPEFGSVWCWFASGMVGLYALEPTLFACIDESRRLAGQPRGAASNHFGSAYSLESPTRLGRLCVRAGVRMAAATMAGNGVELEIARGGGSISGSNREIMPATQMTASAGASGSARYSAVFDAPEVELADFA